MKNRAVFIPACLLAAALLAGCGRAGSLPASAGQTPAPASPVPAQTAQPQAPSGCPDYAWAMADAAGPGDIDPAYTDADTCLQNAYALAAALFRGDAGAAAAACGVTAEDLAHTAGAAQDDRFPFADLTGLQVEGFAFSGGGAGEPLWLTLSVAEPGTTPLPQGTTVYAVEFGDGYYTAAGCVQALVPQGSYLPQSGGAYTAVSSFRNWVTTQPWQDAGSLPGLGMVYYLSGFASGRGLEPSGGAGSGVWDGEVLAGQAQDAFGVIPYFLQDRYAAAFNLEGYSAVYDESTDTFLLAASPGDTGRNRRMTAFTQNADGTASLTIARGANSLWMAPDQQVTYTMRQNADGSWAILRADWAGGSKTPEYQIWDAAVRLENGQPLPDTLPLAADLTGTANGGGLTWRQAAERFGMPEDTLRALNPDARCNPDGTLNDTLLLDPAYALPDANAQKMVHILVPWEDFQGGRSYPMPAGLDDAACIAAAEALDFLWHHNVRLGYFPAEPVEGENGAELYRAAEGARFTRYGELQTHLEAVFTPELAQSYAAGGYEEQYRAYIGYLAGENGALCFGGGERGTNPAVLAQLCTAPQTQPDGSVVFGLLGLECDVQDSRPFAEREPVRAVWHTIRLVPAGDGWRVAEAELAV